MPLSPPDDLVRGFRESFTTLVGQEAAGSAVLGLGVSGGPDSLAMLLLAAAALPGRVIAATVDHKLRPESAAEAELVADLCTRLEVPHVVLALEWTGPAANRQAAAREARYDRLGRWALDRQARFIATAHHADDQAETLLMRLDRGAGVGGLAGIRSRRLLVRAAGQEVDLIRPLLSWRRTDLRRTVDHCDERVAKDASNLDPAYDRTRARAFLDASPEWPDRRRLAASARHLDESDRALEWAAMQLAATRENSVDGACDLDVAGVPPELRRRMVRNLVRSLGHDPAGEPRGDVLARAIGELQCGRVVTLAGMVIRPTGDCWRFERAPPRRP